MTEMGKPRPIAEQTWRAHHTGRGNYGGVPSATSGCARRRRKRIERRLFWVPQRWMTGVGAARWPNLRPMLEAADRATEAMESVGQTMDRFTTTLPEAVEFRGRGV